MTRIITSKRQKVCRAVFKKAVAYARNIIHNPEKKKALQERFRKGKNLYNAAIKKYMLRIKAEVQVKCAPYNKPVFKFYKPSKRKFSIPVFKKIPGIKSYSIDAFARKIPLNRFVFSNRYNKNRYYCFQVIQIWQMPH